jgi:demethylmenaquinone methyltransferase/2-methoxy-6-polyprenyl-1,4-benzoquinol methylase
METGSKINSWQIFNSIAHRYDLLNRLLSFGQDRVWRRKIADYLPPGKTHKVLDLATGTADVLLILNKLGRVSLGVGIDMSRKMLDIGRQKVARHSAGDSITLFPGDAARIPLKTSCFDVVTMAFGIRNVTEPLLCLKEIHRVLKPGRRTIILEFSLPHNFLLRGLYLTYFRHILPHIGAVISGDSHAYRYLNKTVETFPFGKAFMKLLSQTGFQDVQAHPLNFGIATIYCADKD